MDQDALFPRVGIIRTCRQLHYETAALPLICSGAIVIKTVGDGITFFDRLSLAQRMLIKHIHIINWWTSEEFEKLINWRTTEPPAFPRFGTGERKGQIDGSRVRTEFVFMRVVEDFRMLEKVSMTSHFHTLWRADKREQYRVDQRNYDDRQFTLLDLGLSP